METIKINNINELLKFSIPIGMGNTAICYLLPDKTIAKIFFKSYCYDFYWNKEEIRNHFELLSLISNDSFIGSEKFIIKDGICIGYIYPFIKAKTLHSISSKEAISNLLKSYEKLYIDTKKISELGFQLRDLHDKNILYSDLFKVIDLDKGDKSLIYKTKEELFNANMKNINYTIIDAIFKISFHQSINFLDDKIDKLYIDSAFKDSDKFKELLETMANDYEKPTIKTLRKNIQYNKTNNYYSYY